MIRLGQLLKFSGLADSGAEARTFLDEGLVSVNGEPESRRGRQLHHGDTVTVEAETVLVQSPSKAPPRTKGRMLDDTPDVPRM